MIGVLRQLEWIAIRVNGDPIEMCWVCKNNRRLDHRPGCEMALLLAGHVPEPYEAEAKRLRVEVARLKGLLMMQGGRENMKVS